MHAVLTTVYVSQRAPYPLGKAKFSDLLIPWSTFTEPEVAHVGLYPRDMEANQVAYDTYTKQVSSALVSFLPGCCYVRIIHPLRIIKSNTLPHPFFIMRCM